MSCKKNGKLSTSLLWKVFDELSGVGGWNAPNFLLTPTKYKLKLYTLEDPSNHKSTLSAIDGVSSQAEKVDLWLEGPPRVKI